MKRISFLFFAMALLTMACRKTPDFDQLSYQFLVSTSQDKTADFKSYSTFSISDTIMYIGGVGSDSILVGTEATQLVQTVKDNMVARGYSFVSRTSHPDLGLSLTAIKNTNIVIDYYPGWWDGYWGDCYWYWCYPYYYPWTTVYSYTTGSVILNMYDLKNVAATKSIKGIWNTTALGALGSSVSTNLTLGINAINQGFVQSPYIQK